MTIDTFCIIAVLALSVLKAQRLASDKPQAVVFVWVQRFDVMDLFTARTLPPQIVPLAEIGVPQDLDITRTWVDVQWLVNTLSALITDDWT